MIGNWQTWALLSAGFAALTAIFAKVGIENINSDFAALIRTIVILIVAGGICRCYSAIPKHRGTDLCANLSLFLVLGDGDWRFVVCVTSRALKLGNASQVAPIDKLRCIVLVAIFGVAFLGELEVGAGWAWA